MSDYLAVAAVSLVLKSFLTEALNSPAISPASIYGNNVSVSVLAPDVVLSNSVEPVRLNLFMYYSSINAAIRNAGRPAYGSDGQRVANPPLALELHYLVSGYGPGEFDSEILLGWAMQQLHETPIFSRTSIQDYLTAASLLPTPSPEVQAIVQSTLPFQLESIRVTPASLSNDDITRLWMAFSTPYRPTTAYTVSVVLIQQIQSFKSNLPVQKRNLLVLPLQGPVIDTITPSAAVAGTFITLTGRNFIGDNPLDTQVLFGNDPPVSPDALTPLSIRFAVPATGLAGVTTIRIATRVTFGSSGDPHTGAHSNSMPFMLLPTITNTSPSPIAPGGTMTLTLTPQISQLQEATVFLGNYSIVIPPRKSGAALSSTLDVPIPSASNLPFAVPTTVPLRIELDRAQSPLTLTGTQFLPEVVLA